jgi:arylsulfatase A-like enzyme
MLTRGILIGLALFTGGLFAAAPAGRANRSRPNILLILSDDQGTLDAGCYGAKDLKTPSLDRLAREGVRFTQFYAAAPVCSPSRAALLTGKYPQRAGLVTNSPSQPAGVGGLPPEQVTLAETLWAAGYATGHVGKWHLGYTKDTMPLAQGFDFSFGHMGGCIDNFSHFFYWDGPNRHDLWRDGVETWEDGRFFGDLMVREAGGFLERNRSRPFFLYWAINLPHYPLQGSERWRREYRDLPTPRREYAAAVSTMDELVGKVLRRLDALGLRENTIVVFQSDHGHSTEVRTFGGGGYAGSYRGAKFSLFEGGIRVPAIVRAPKRWPRGVVRNQFATGIDWFPTLATAAGASVPAGVDGKDLNTVLRSASAPTPHPTFHWQSGGGANRPQWAVRDGRWKLVANGVDTSAPAGSPPVDPVWLSDLESDPGERRNVATEDPEAVVRLTRLHEEWATRVRE